MDVIVRGAITGVSAGLMEARMPGVAVGDGAIVESDRGGIPAVVTSLRNGRAVLRPQFETDGVAVGDEVRADPAALSLPLGTILLGRCIDSYGRPLDGGARLAGRGQSLHVRAPSPAERAAIAHPFWTGVRAIDGLLTIGRGARVGVFGPPGAGKSSLLHSIVRGSHADAVVVGLVGERGREAEEWMRVAPAHACIVCATGDRSAPERIRAARAAMAQAHALRSRGLHVLLVLDSLARFAAALREVAVGNGEAVGRGGYPAAVFSELAGFVEIAGTAPEGSITLIASVLSDGDERDPVSEAARSLLDGHIQLSAGLAQAGRFPAIDLLASASRTASSVMQAPHSASAQIVRRAIAALAETADARALGILPAEPQALRAAAAEPVLEAFLRQGGAAGSPAGVLSALHALADTLR